LCAGDRSLANAHPRTAGECFQAQSRRELDEAEELDSGDPADLAEHYVALRGDLPNLEVVGGCCGTDIRHVTAICDAWLAAG
jgi:S-methylmethionine-dependent homocysteine/selenocysteine methylase